MGSATIGPRSEDPTIRVPRWIQLVVLPVILLLVGALGHAIRRGIGVAVVNLTFSAAGIVLVIALGTLAVEQTRSAADPVDNHLTDAPGRGGDSAFEGGGTDLEEWLRGHGIDVELRALPRKRDRGRPSAGRCSA